MTTATRPIVDDAHALEIKPDRWPLGVCWLIWMVLGAASWSAILVLL